MKKSFIAFLLCCSLLFNMMFQYTSVALAEEGNTEQPTTESTDIIETTTEIEIEDEAEVTTESEVEDESEATTESEVEDEAEATTESEVEDEAEVTTESEVEDESEVTTESEVEDKAEATTEVKEETIAALYNTTRSQWVSFEEYLQEEIAAAWENPSIYVGQTAYFNSYYSIELSSGMDENGEWGDSIYLNSASLFGEDGKPIQVVITDYYLDEQVQKIWYKVEAAEGYTLPDQVVEHPYVYHVASYDTVPTLIMLPMKGMFVEGTVWVQDTIGNTDTTSRIEINIEAIPDYFDIMPVIPDSQNAFDVKYYDLGDVSGWGIEGVTPAHRYVPESQIILAPAIVTRAYEDLMNAESTDDYQFWLSVIPEEVIAQLTENQLADIEEHVKYLYRIENVEKTATVTIGDVVVPVTVRGKIPMDGTLSVEAVTSETVMAEGFDIKDATEIVTALDIKIYDKDGVEWQPEDGNLIWVSIGMAELGYADGSVLKLQHKHGEKIDIFDVFVVMDGKLTVGINGFSIFVVADESSTTGQEVSNGNNYPLQVGGDPVVFYCNPAPPPTNNGWETPDENYEAGTWRVIDTSGAIYYTVHSNSSGNGAIDNNGIYAPWIKIYPLKPTTTETQITLIFEYANITTNQYNQSTLNWINSETYTLDIVPPKADAANVNDPYELYIKDTVNTTGTITATLVDKDGNEVTEETLGGSLSCSWVRSDGSFIIPAAYQNGGKSIDICRDHGGLLQTRLENIVYTVTAKLPNGRTKTASYKVYYQSEILNPGFEKPGVNADTYTFLTNGWPELYWKTTSPGEGVHLSKDVELAHYSENWDGVINQYSKFFPTDPGEGYQIAELNAEKFGALYQDIITAPGEELTWDFLHAKRDENKNGEAMYLIMGPTEHAQGVTDYEDLSELIDAILGANSPQAIDNMRNNGGSISYTYTDKETGAKYTYTAWYHSAEDDGRSADDAWTLISGEYEVPQGQYRTRLFFVTDPNAAGSVGESNYGNLIDSARGGQYKRYLIEYYEEDYVTDEKTGDTIIKRTHIVEDDETDRAPIYSSVNLEHFDKFEEKNEILSTVYINGVNSPYNIRYAGVPCLFIEKYSPEASTTPRLVPVSEDADPNDYSEYDIVMQVCFRKTMVAVQKWVTFPKIGDTETEALTMEQKQVLIDGMKAKKGYEAHYILDCETEECKKKEEGHMADDSIFITKNDPEGWYTGYIPMGYDLDGNHSFKLAESTVSPLIGLEIAKVEFKYYQFHMGELTLMGKKTYVDKPEDYTDYDKYKPELDTLGTGYTVNYIDTGKLELESNPDGDGYVLVYNNNGVKEEVFIDNVLINSKDDERKIAEVKVTNTYREKKVKYNYVAVGQGTVAIQNEDKEHLTSDSEEFLYYSGDPKGVIPYPAPNYTFAGWYLDEKCTIPVDANHGYVDGDNKFVPNKAKTVTDDVLEVTYYAKFSIGSIQIIRENAEPGQVFVYKVEDEANNVMYVTVVVGPDGKGSTEIVNVPFGENNSGRWYKVTQLNDWSWRHGETDRSIREEHKEDIGLHGSKVMTTVFTFANPPEADPPIEQIDEYWLNGNSKVKVNTYGGTANEK